jgi:hypothetical protein
MAVEAVAKSLPPILIDETVFSAWYFKSVVKIRRKIGSNELVAEVAEERVWEDFRLIDLQ